MTRFPNRFLNQMEVHVCLSFGCDVTSFFWLHQQLPAMIRFDEHLYFDLNIGFIAKLKKNNKNKQQRQKKH